MVDVRIDEALWENAMAPEGLLTRWVAAEGAHVQRGAHLADVLIEGALHEIMAPVAGRLWREVKMMSLVEPGTVIGQITAP